MFKNKKGRLPIQSGANPDENFQNFVLGWIEFIKNAQKYQSEFIVLADIPAEILFNRLSELLCLFKGQWLHAHEFGDASAVVKPGQSAFQAALMEKEQFLSTGQKEGAACPFTRSDRRAYGEVVNTTLLSRCRV